MASASSSSTDTSWPSSIIELAMAEPTRPQPTIKTNISSDNTPGERRNLRSGRSGQDALPCALLALRRGGQKHLARRLLDHVAGGLPDEPVAHPAATSEDGAPAQAAGLLGAQHDGLD